MFELGASKIRKTHAFITEFAVPGGIDKTIYRLLLYSFEVIAMSDTIYKNCIPPHIPMHCRQKRIVLNKRRYMGFVNRNHK